ncbi:hypothetical protein BKA93DRAFT_828004 [Sparassis latifolia]
MSPTRGGFALPTIMITGVVNRFRHDDGYDSRHTTSHSFVGWAPWIGICLAIWTMALIIAEVIPFFNDLLGVIGSMFARWFIYGITGVLWFH